MPDDATQESGEQHAGAVPQTVPELYWRLVFFAAGVLFAGLVL